MSTVTATAYQYGVNCTRTFRALKRKKAQKSNGFRANSTYRHCIKDNALIDPAVGSSAFRLGMLNEIVRDRQNITTYMDITLTGENYL